MYNPHNLRSDSFNCINMRLIAHVPCESDIFALLQKCFDCPHQSECLKAPEGAYPKDVILQYGSPDENFGYCPRAFQLLSDENEKLSQLLDKEDLKTYPSLF